MPRRVSEVLLRAFVEYFTRLCSVSPTVADQQTQRQKKFRPLISPCLFLPSPYSYSVAAGRDAHLSTA